MVGVSPDALVGIPRELSTDNLELGAELTSFNGLDDGFLEPSTGVSAAPVDGVVPEMASRSNSLAAVTTHVATPTDHSIEPSAHTDWFNWLNQADGRATASSVNRDYNYFDELDARLADLQDPSDAFGDR